MRIAMLLALRKATLGARPRSKLRPNYGLTMAIGSGRLKLGII
jgi:hypothetical protein